MNLRKQYIALLLFAALLLGFIGSYVGVKLAQPSNTVNQEQSFENGQSGSEIQIDTPDEMDKIVQAFGLIKQHYIEDVEDDELIEGAIQGMLGTLGDPYSTYMDLETMERFNEQIESSFEGIGAEVSMVNGKVTIIAPIKDSPAEKVGLRPNDQIIGIDKEDISGLDLHEAVERIRGEKGSTVVLEVLRLGATEPFEVEIIRDKIPIETVYSSVNDIEGKKTGLIEITSFSETTANDFIMELEKLEEDGIEGLVLDVRGNPGGLLNSVEDILKHFIPKDTPYLQIEDQQGKKDPYYSTLVEKKDYPISVVINEGSASASEILAVALKEVGYDVIGVASYGKGTVQQAVPLGDGSTIKLTFFKWLSPEGNWINETGVEPTLEIKQPNYYYSNPIQIESPLAFNDNGENIENIQHMLNGIGYETGREDGYFDEGTVEAVKLFQKDNDLNDSGEIDEKTAELIETKIVEKIRSGEDDVQLEKAYEALYE